MNIVQLTEEIEDIDKKVFSLVDWIVSHIPNMLSGILLAIVAIIIFAIGRKLINLLVKLLDKSFRKSSMDLGVIKFLNSFIRISLNIVLIVVIAGFVGLETTSLATIIGSAGLAIGLSLQGSLSNFAGGVLVLILRPFTIGDYIISGSNEGVVKGIDIFYTRLLTADNKLVVIPNGALSNSPITNVTNQDIRRVDIVVGVDYSEDIRKVKNLLSDIANNYELIEKDKGVDIFVDELASSSVNIGFRVWAKTENYWKVKWDMNENIKYEFDKAGISIPFDQLDVSIKKED
ncbi:MAG: mechanosensitive ion channel [Lachnospiraceae bacterium]|nr:mechanosensitive ion channel [Lachnoclostridium sp.]MDD7521626.1 mechanosensitive ion channel [Lachnoclostridium sp.]MDY2599546.1 mechanosensitive ion channel [Lachnospiraceae bacterium]